MIKVLCVSVCQDEVHWSIRALEPKPGALLKNKVKVFEEAEANARLFMPRRAEEQHNLDTFIEQCIDSRKDMADMETKDSEHLDKRDQTRPVLVPLLCLEVTCAEPTHPLWWQSYMTSMILVQGMLFWLRMVSCSSTAHSRIAKNLSASVQQHISIPVGVPCVAVFKFQVPHLLSPLS